MFATRFIESWLFEVRRGDPLTFVVENASVDLDVVGADEHTAAERQQRALHHELRNETEARCPE